MKPKHITPVSSFVFNLNHIRQTKLKKGSGSRSINLLLLQEEYFGFWNEWVLFRTAALTVSFQGIPSSLTDKMSCFKCLIRCNIGQSLLGRTQTRVHCGFGEYPIEDVMYHDS